VACFVLPTDPEDLDESQVFLLTPKARSLFVGGVEGGVRLNHAIFSLTHSLKHLQIGSTEEKTITDEIV